MLSSRPQSLLKRFWLTTLRPATAVPAILPMAQQAQQASTSGRTAVRVPGPVETSMQQKVGHERVSEELGEREHRPEGPGCAVSDGKACAGPGVLRPRTALHLFRLALSLPMVTTCPR